MGNPTTTQIQRRHEYFVSNEDHIHARQKPILIILFGVAGVRIASRYSDTPMVVKHPLKHHAASVGVTSRSRDWGYRRWFYPVE